MNYIVRRDQLEKLANGDIKVDDIASLDNIALITWSGIDLREMAQRGYNATEVTEDDIDQISDLLGHVDCSICIESAVSFVFDDQRSLREKQKKELSHADKGG
jgi:hypothetical protein